MQIEIENIEPIHVAYMRHIGPYTECGVTWQALVKWAIPRGLISAATKMFGIGHDDPRVTPQETLRYDACFSVSENFQPEGEVQVQTIPGGKYAVATVVGPYDRLPGAYMEFVGPWLENSGEKRAGYLFEQYMNNPETTPPAELLTEIYLPLE